MKKLFALLFCTLAIGAAFAEELFYEIDPVATANAHWTVGEKIIKDGSCKGIEFNREFLGVTQSGLALVQDFYLSGEKLTNPFLMTVTNAGKNAESTCFLAEEGVYTYWDKSAQKRGEGSYKKGKRDGLLTLWHENGQKQTEINYKSGEFEGLTTIWYENGQKEMEAIFRNNGGISILREWDEKGNLIKEQDFDTPKD